MEPETTTKRNIFRASLRRQFIQSYQHSIRMKYLQIQLKQSSHNITSVDSKLSEILLLPSHQICKVQHFEYFLQCTQTIFPKKNISACDSAFKRTSHEWSSQSPTHQSRDNQFCSEGSKLHIKTYNISQKRSSKISGTWVQKQKIFSLLYRILDKSFSEENGRLWYVIDRALYLLQFPELMPLWEKLSSISDKKSKNFCCKQFSKKLLKSGSSSMMQFQIILDPEFVLDILTNFIVQSPSVSFESMLELMPFISYSLRVQGENIANGHEAPQSNYPSLNKICIILRSILKEDSKNRLARLVDSGYAEIFTFLIQSIYTLFKHEAKIMPGRNQPAQKTHRRDSEVVGARPTKIAGYHLECGYLENAKNGPGSWSKRPTNLQIVTKTNLIKFLHRLFVSNPEVATFLLVKLQNPYFLHSLFSQFADPDRTCQPEYLQELKPQFPSKYESIILCDSHQLLLKSVLSTLHTIIATGASVGYSFISEFLRCEGVLFLERCVNMDKVENKYGKDIVSIMGGLDSEGEQFYGKLNQEDFVRFVRTGGEMISAYGIRYIQHKRQLPYCTSSVSINEFIQFRYCFLKQLKITRCSLLIAYARATQPGVFEASSAYFLYSECLQVLEQVLKLKEMEQSEDEQIRALCGQIVSLCSNPKGYMQQHNRPCSSQHSHNGSASNFRINL